MKQSCTLVLLTALILVVSLILGNKKEPSDYSSYIDELIHANDDFPSLTQEQLEILKEDKVTGKMVKIAMIDSPIKTNEIFIKEKIKIIKEELSPNSQLTHGTISALLLKKDIAPDVILYSIEVLDSMGIGTYEDVIKGIEWCIEHQVDIITFSLIGYEYSKELHQAIQKAKQNNIILIAAAGNHSSNLPTYPAAFSEVISVGALDVNNRIASYSNFGKHVDIYALGDIKEYNISGTSFAVPFVAGFIALLKEALPLTNQEIFTLLTDLP